jgi:hypothetical protein
MGLEDDTRAVRTDVADLRREVAALRELAENIAARLPPAVMTKGQFGERYKKSPSTVARWCKDGTLKLIGKGRRALIDVSAFKAVDKALNAEKVAGKLRAVGGGK